MNEGQRHIKEKVLFESEVKTIREFLTEKGGIKFSQESRKDQSDALIERCSEIFRRVATDNKGDDDSPALLLNEILIINRSNGNVPALPGRYNILGNDFPLIIKKTPNRIGSNRNAQFLVAGINLATNEYKEDLSPKTRAEISEELRVDLSPKTRSYMSDLLRDQNVPFILSTISYQYGSINTIEPVAASPRSANLMRALAQMSIEFTRIMDAVLISPVKITVEPFYIEKPGKSELFRIEVTSGGTVYHIDCHDYLICEVNPQAHACFFRYPRIVLPVQLKVRIGRSNIPNGGLGVFATQAIQNGDWIGKYEGRHVLSLQLEEKGISKSNYLVGGTWVTVDGNLTSEDATNFGPRVNHQWHSNVETVEYLYDRYFRCRTDHTDERDIKVNDELYYNYGEKYWFDKFGTDKKTQYWFDEEKTNRADECLKYREELQKLQGDFDTLAPKEKHRWGIRLRLMLPDLTNQDWIYRYTQAIFDYKEDKEKHLDKFGSITKALRVFYSQLPNIYFWKNAKDSVINDYIRRELAALDED